MKLLPRKHGKDWCKEFKCHWCYDRSRPDYFYDHIKDKKVLHVGCTDHPFDPEGSLHTTLYGYKELHGLDIDAEGIEQLRKLVSGHYYTDPQKIKESYDVILIPETIEHLANPGYFLENIDQITCDKLIITVPDVTLHYYNDYFEYDHKAPLYLEAIHSDHFAWYSPYTIKNLIQKNTSYKVDKIDLLHNSVVAHATKQPDKKIRKSMNKGWGTVFLK